MNKQINPKNTENEKIQKSEFEKNWPFYLMIIIEIGFLILYATLTDYSDNGVPGKAAINASASTEEIKHRYPFFQDVNVMIFVGFGFLMTFLKTYSWSAVGLNFIIAAWVIQISILTNGLWKNAIKGKWQTIQISLDTIIDADFAAGAALIAFGGVLGKLNFLQYIFMASFQTVFYSLTFAVGAYVFKVVDIGGSMFIHAFGAYFGVFASLAYKGKVKNFRKCGANYNSNIFAFIGTVFLWMFWPSFNGALSSGNAQQRAIINTYLSLTGSCVAVFILSHPIKAEGKLNAEFVLNATLAGGVMIGNTADLIIKPWIAILIGFCAGFVSLLGYNFINPFLFKNLKLHDTCGIHYLHGITGLFGGVIGIIFTAMADEKDLGASYKILYGSWETRTSSRQALFQLAALGLVMGVSSLSGYICGLILRCFEVIENPFDDESHWETEEDELELIKWKRFESIVNSPRKTPMKNAQEGNFNNNEIENFDLAANNNNYNSNTKGHLNNKYGSNAPLNNNELRAAYGEGESNNNNRKFSNAGSCKGRDLNIELKDVKVDIENNLNNNNNHGNENVNLKNDINNNKISPRINMNNESDNNIHIEEQPKNTRNLRPE